MQIIFCYTEFSRLVWPEALSRLGLVGAFPKKWADFILVRWHFRGNKEIFKCVWRFMVHAVAWLLWTERNKRIFEDKCSSAKEIWNRVCSLVGLWAKAVKLFDSLDSFLFSLDPGSFLMDV